MKNDTTDHSTIDKCFFVTIKYKFWMVAVNKDD